MPDAPASCAMCGARLEWSPGEAATVCPHCGTVNERSAAPAGPWGIEKAEIAERDLAGALDAEAPPVETEARESIACPGCGAEIAFDAETLAEDCPFCGTPLARAGTHAHEQPKPQAVLPFALGAEEARAAVGRWLGRLWFAPSDLARFARRDRPLTGVYLPHYTYDADIAASYTGERGEAGHVRIGTGRNRASRRRIRWRSVSGRVRRRFDDVVVPASDKLPESQGGGFAGWDLQALEPYATRFLAGFRTELPGLSPRDGWARARDIMEGVIRDDIRRDIGGDEQRIAGLDLAIRDVSFKHVLLPVWLGTYRYRGRLYRLVVNARTGKVAGARPYSRWKIALAVLLGVILAIVLGLVLGR